MNINELNRIKTFNVESALNNATIGTGTFSNILEKVYDNTIIPLTDNEGNIVGVNYDAKAKDIIEDNIAQLRFTLAYTGKPLMGWILTALAIKADYLEMPKVIENEEKLAIELKDGKEIVLEDYTEDEDNYEVDDYEDYGDEKCEDPGEYNYIPKKNLPQILEICADEFEAEPTLNDIKDYLRKTYKRYIKRDCDMTFEKYANNYIVKDIEWGRRIQ